MAAFAVQSDALFIIPDYRLAAVKAIIERYNTSTIILSGDSAGGALTIDVVRQLCIQKREYKKIRGLILLSPWVDPLTKLGSMVTNQANDYLSSHFVNRSLDAVLNGQSAESERINFTQMDLSMLPRTLIQCGSGEVFFDQIQTFSERLKQQGVNCTLQNFVVQCHVFQLFSSLSQPAKNAIIEIAKMINAQQDQTKR